MYALSTCKDSDGATAAARYCTHDHEMSCGACNRVLQALTELELHVKAAAAAMSSADAAAGATDGKPGEAAPAGNADAAVALKALQDACAELPAQAENVVKGVQGYMAHRLEACNQQCAMAAHLQQASPDTGHQSGDYMMKLTSMEHRFVARLDLQSVCRITPLC